MHIKEPLLLMGNCIMTLVMLFLVGNNFLYKEIYLKDNVTVARMYL